MSNMTRNGKQLTDLGDGHKRRLSDGRNAWRKMSPEQRATFLAWIEEQGLPVAGGKPATTEEVRGYRVALSLIASNRDVMAEEGEWIEGTVAPGQAFDDWAADLAEQVYPNPEKGGK